MATRCRGGGVGATRAIGSTERRVDGGAKGARRDTSTGHTTPTVAVTVPGSDASPSWNATKQI